MKKTIREYIDDKMEGRLTRILTLDEVMDDLDLSLKDALFCMSNVGYQIKRHPDYDWTFVIFDKVKIQQKKTDGNVS